MLLVIIVYSPVSNWARLSRKSICYELRNHKPGIYQSASLTQPLYPSKTVSIRQWGESSNIVTVFWLQLAVLYLPFPYFSLFRSIMDNQTASIFKIWFWSIHMENCMMIFAPPAQSAQIMRPYGICSEHWSWCSPYGPSGKVENSIVDDTTDCTMWRISDINRLMLSEEMTWHIDMPVRPNLSSQSVWAMIAVCMPALLRLCYRKYALFRLAWHGYNPQTYNPTKAVGTHNRAIPCSGQSSCL